jgi:hypothetical protein
MQVAVVAVAINQHQQRAVSEAVAQVVKSTLLMGLLA